jgi:hypothetical protein
MKNILAVMLFMTLSPLLASAGAEPIERDSEWIAWQKTLAVKAEGNRFKLFCPNMFERSGIRALNHVITEGNLLTEYGMKKCGSVNGANFYELKLDVRNNTAVLEIGNAFAARYNDPKCPNGVQVIYPEYNGYPESQYKSVGGSEPRLYWIPFAPNKCNGYTQTKPGIWWLAPINKIETFNLKCSLLKRDAQLNTWVRCSSDKADVTVLLQRLYQK